MARGLPNEAEIGPEKFGRFYLRELLNSGGGHGLGVPKATSLLVGRFGGETMVPEEPVRIARHFNTGVRAHDHPVPERWLRFSVVPLGRGIS